MKVLDWEPLDWALAWLVVVRLPDLLPGDITGVSIYNQAGSEFEFHPGPIFANIVLADEINRASPKTQSYSLHRLISKP